MRTLSCSKYCGSKFYIILVSPVGPHWGLYHCKLLSVCWHVLNMSEFMACMISLIFMLNEIVIKMMSHGLKSSDLHLSSCWKSLPRSFCTCLVELGTQNYERKYSTCAMYSWLQERYFLVACSTWTYMKIISRSVQYSTCRWTQNLFFLRSVWYCVSTVPILT